MKQDAILADVMFWGRLTRATCASMAASNDVELRRQWIDDLISESCRPSNEALLVSGVAHVMGHKNGQFGDYRFSALLPWTLVRHPDRQFTVQEIVLDHGPRELVLAVVAVEKKPNQSLEPTRVLGTSAAEPPRVPSTRVAHL